MILTTIRLKNFRQYRGLQELSLSVDPDRNVTVITGPNGAGKTNLFLALNWCLYGKGLEGKGALSTKEAEDGSFVEVHFRHEGVKYLARREVTSIGDVQSTGDLALTALAAGGRSEPIPNPGQKMNEILPADARQYFFFDGERIDEMSRPGHEEQVREAIRSVLKFKVVERAIQHLNDVERDFATEVRKLSAQDEETKGLIADLETLRDQQARLKEQRQSLQSEIEAASRQLDDATGRLRSLESVREIMLEEATKDKELASAEQRAAHLVEVLAEGVSRAGPAFAFEAIALAGETLDDKRRRGEIPSSVREQLITDLLREGRCICGRNLDANSKKHLLHRKHEAIPSDVEDAVLLASGHVKNLAQVAENIPMRIREALMELAGLRGEMEDLHREKEAIRDRIAEQLQDGTLTSSGEDIMRLEGTRRQLETTLSDLRFDLGKIEKEVELREKEIEAKAFKLARVESQTAAARKAKRRYELARMAADSAEHLLSVFSTNMRQRIEDATHEIFEGLIWKDQQFERAKILEDYRLDVIDRFGGSALSELSAGERQVLSLAFIVAMSRVTGEEAPLVIDTPFGRISETPLHNIASALPEISGQLVLLVTDRELDEFARKELEPSIGMEYELVFDDSTGHTAISRDGDNG